jgi:phosphotransferase system enzyme I (PtsI)
VNVHRGKTVAAGVSVGHVYLQGYDAAEGYTTRIPSNQVEEELNRLREALAASRAQFEEIKAKQQDNLGESELRIFDTHIAYLTDPLFVSEIEKMVTQERYSARTSIKSVVDDYDRIFQLVEDNHLRQRAGDFRDVATRLLRNLDGGSEQRSDDPRPTGRYILAARKLTTADMFNLDNEQVEGIVAEEGGISSHAGILARSMGIPTITGIRDLPGKLENGDWVILDAGAGELHVNPDERLLSDYTQSAERWRESRAQVPSGDRKHATRDGTEVRLLGSCGNLGEVNLARTFGMDGIGLFRTELLFLVNRKTPSEEILEHHYQEVVRQPDQQPVNLRLLDVSANAQVPGLPRERELNLAMGMRGVRALLSAGNIMRLQLRAILRAAAGTTNTGLLVPFVTSVTDIQRVKAAIVEERLALRKEGVACADSLLVAPIVEVPAAAFVLHAFLNESDFVVVAIDDLQAHLFAADRDNPAVREYYAMMHPALFELLSRMAKDATRFGKDLVLFGEGAGDPLRVPFYLGIGIRSFSVAPVRLNGMLKVLSRFTMDECRRISDRVLEAPRAIDVHKVLAGLAER